MATCLIAACCAAAGLAEAAPASAAQSAQTTARAAPPARPAGPKYHLLGFSLSGSKRVDTSALVAALPQHEGDVITEADIKEDADHIRAALDARHVHGDMTTALLEQEGKGHHIWVVWDIHLVDALSFKPGSQKRYFAKQDFSGNVKLSNDALATATGLHPGDKMPDGSLSDARTGIEQAYDKALPGAPVEVQAKVKVRKGNNVEIDWRISEPHEAAPGPVTVRPPPPTRR
jgi:hypothetical protein